MDNMHKLKIAITKRQIPVLYLDTCALIELAKYEKGCCTDAHSNLIGELYNKVSSMMQTKKFCVLWVINLKKWAQLRIDEMHGISYIDF